MATNAANREGYLQFEDHMVFICPECGKAERSQQDWRKHLNILHNYAGKSVEDFDFKEIDKKYHECQICLKWVANAHQTIALLQYHRFLHLPYPRTYRCRHCPASFTRKRALGEHLCKNHSRLIERLEHERKLRQAKLEAELVDPKQNSEFYIRFVCPLCEKQFDRHSKWQMHIDRAHKATSVDLRMHRINGTKNYFCGDCSITIKNPLKSRLQRHRFTHLPYYEYFECAYCAKRQQYKTEIFLHFLQRHNAEYLKYKQHIKAPCEWGGEANEEVLQDIVEFLENERKSRTDILQKAMQDSFLSPDDEAGGEEQNAKLEDKMEKSGREDFITDKEFEEIFDVIFEEVKDNGSCHDSPIRKRLKLDFSNPISDSKDDTSNTNMLKYIHYICPECGKEFNTQTIWRNHVFQDHNLTEVVETKFRALNRIKTLYLCLVCHQVQRPKTHADLRRHHFQHMPYQAYLKCTICAKTKSSKPKMLQHLHFHSQAMAREREAAARDNDEISEDEETPAHKYVCLDCDKYLATSSMIAEHRIQCPNRLQPLLREKYDIKENLKLLNFLKFKANVHINKIAQSEGIDIKNINMAPRK